jgi:hypothetical protein
MITTIVTEDGIETSGTIIEWFSPAVCKVVNGDHKTSRGMLLESVERKYEKEKKRIPNGPQNNVR